MGTRPVLSLACLALLVSASGCASSSLRIRGRSVTRFERASTHFTGQDLALLVDLELRERVRPGLSAPSPDSDHASELTAELPPAKAPGHRVEPACSIPPLCLWEHTQVALALSALTIVHTAERTP